MKDGFKTIILVALFIGLLIVATVIINKQTSTGEVETNANGNKVIPKAAIEVSESNFVKEALEADKKVVIDFYATWCGPCKKISPILEEIAGEHDDIKLIKVDVDKNEVLAQKFNITAMPTLVVLENGEEVGRNVGLVSKQKILEIIYK